MIALIGKYKSVLLFILTFLGSYIVLSVLYGIYLEKSEGSTYFPDFFTAKVAQQSKWLLQTSGYQAAIAPHPDEPSIKLSVEGNYLARVVEGCNSLSIIILFCSFLLAFFNGWKKTLLFAILGSIAIYMINVGRIAFLSVALYHYPEYTDFLHSIVFPMIIYGFVFILWFVWIYKFSTK